MTISKGLWKIYSVLLYLVAVPDPIFSIFPSLTSLPKTLEIIGPLMSGRFSHSSLLETGSRELRTAYSTLEVLFGLAPTAVAKRLSSSL